MPLRRLKPALEAEPLRVLAFSFLGLIAVGTLLLRLPAATTSPIGWVDALFTATSATCVTGLAVRDTGSGFTAFGQAVILVLIQLGGLGIMTFSFFVLALFRRRASLAQRSILELTVAARPGKGVWPLLRLVFFFTFAVELVGILLLYLRWSGPMGRREALYAAVFHSISAFCNAGFSLWVDNLSAWRGDPLVVLVISSLIVLGGLGYFTVAELLAAVRSRRRMSVHSRMALWVSAFLIVAGTVMFWGLEAGRTLAGMPGSEQLLAAFFQSVTTRTAGFNTVDIGALGPPTLLTMIVLMFIGGSPGSCAGGIKTTTFGVVAAATLTRARGHRNVNAFHRTLEPMTVRAALTIGVTGTIVVLAGLFAIDILQPPGGTPIDEQARFLDHAFETVSALGTVGLSTGVTAELTMGSRLVVTLLMFLGRLGPLAIASALAARHRVYDWEYPVEEVMVG